MAERNLAGITGKIKLHGTIELLSPLLIGSGQLQENIRNVDIQVLRNKENVPYIPGTSFIGVLREWTKEKDTDILYGDTPNRQSAIACRDILLQNVICTIRDGVGIDSITGTAKASCKYDYETVDRGATGEFEIIITLREFYAGQTKQIREYAQKLADILTAGQIRLGAMTSKGFGQIKAIDTFVEFYDFHDFRAVEAWLLGRPSHEQSRWYDTKTSEQSSGDDTTIYPDDYFVLDAAFAIRHSLIIRDPDGQSQKDIQEDIAAVSLRAGNGEKGDYVIPGTSLKGVLRHQAERILRGLGKDTSCLDELMGCAKDEKKQKSRFIVNESYFKEGVSEVKQPRNRINRFTGATMETALFATKPVWQECPHQKTLRIHWEIKGYPQKGCLYWEIGLSLFLLRELWTGRLAIGGEKSIGRGVLEGLQAEIMYKKKGTDIERYTITDPCALDQDTKNLLERYASTVNELKEHSCNKQI